MYDAAQILSTSGLFTRIGLRESSKSGYSGILDAEAKTTKSGKYYDYYHPLANFVNIKDCQEDKDISTANINTLVQSMRKEAIQSALALVFDERDLLQNEVMFKNENRFSDTITNDGKFVGFEILVPDTDRVLNVLNSVVLQFNGAVTFNLYLFHSSKKSAIKTFSVTTVADDFYKYSFTADNKLFAKSTAYGPGKFYFGYFQDDLGSVQAYDRNYGLAGVKSKMYCAGIKSISVEPDGTNLFNIDEIQYRSECWGMNIDLSSYKDYTNVIMTNQELFDSVQGYAFAIKVLEMIKTTGRVNPTQRMADNLPDIANYDLNDQDADGTRYAGLYTKLKIEVNKVKKSL